MTIEDLNTTTELLVNDLVLEWNANHPEAILAPEMLELISKIVSMALVVGYETGTQRVLTKATEFFASGPNMTGTTLIKYLDEIFQVEIV